MHKPLRAVSIERFSTGYPGIDHLLGGGIIRGSTILLWGSPGVGKTTLLAEISKNVGRKRAGKSARVLFVSGEQDVRTIRKMLPGFGAEKSGVELVCDPDGIDTYKITECAKKLKPVLLVVDTVQTAYFTDVEASQLALQTASVRYFVAFAKESGTAVVLLSHAFQNEKPATGAQSLHLVDAGLRLSPHPVEFCAQCGLRVLSCTKGRYPGTGSSALLLLADGKCAGVDEMLSA